MKIANTYSFVTYTGRQDNNKRGTRVPITRFGNDGDRFEPSGSKPVSKPSPERKSIEVEYSDETIDKAKEEFKTLIHADYNFKRIQEQARIEKVFYLGPGSEEKIEKVDAWKDFLTDPQNKIPYPEKVTVLKGVMQNVEIENCTCPLALKPKTVYSVLQEYRQSPDKESFNFHDRYQEAIRKPYLRKAPAKGDMWMVIPSKTHDQASFDKNVAKLQILSEDNWDTNSYIAEEILREGDFHILIRNGKPLVGMSMQYGKINEIYGKQGNLIPTSALDEIDAHLEETGLKTSDDARSQIDYTKKREDQIGLIKEIINIEDEDSDEDHYSICKTQRILNALGIIGFPDGNGKLMIDHYEIPLEYKDEDLGLDENLLFKNISTIKGNADFSNSNVTDLGILKSINGDVNFGESKLKTTCDLRKVGGSLNASYSALKSLGKIESVGKDLNLEFSKVESTGEIKRVGGSVYYSNSKVTSTGKLEYVGGDIVFTDSNVTGVKGLKQVDGEILTYKSKLYKKDLTHVKNAQNHWLTRFLRSAFHGDKQ